MLCNSKMDESMMYNNEAIKCLRNGNSREALSALRNAVSSLYNNDKTPFVSHQAPMPEFELKDVFHRSVELSKLEDQSGFFLFSRAISIDVFELPENHDTHIFMLSLLSIYAFNTAIVLHKVGVARTSSVYIRKAKQLYKDVYRMLKPLKCGGTLGLLKVASINNLSNILYSQADPTASWGWKCLEDALQEMGSDLKTDELMRKCELSGLFANLLCVQTQLVAAAA